MGRETQDIHDLPLRPQPQPETPGPHWLPRLNARRGLVTGDEVARREKDPYPVRGSGDDCGQLERSLTKGEAEGVTRWEDRDGMKSNFDRGVA